VPESTRMAAANQLARSQQAARSSASLWASGHLAEGLRLGVESLELSIDATSELAAALEPAEPLPAAEASPPTEAEPADDSAEPAEEAPAPDAEATDDGSPAAEEPPEPVETEPAAPSTSPTSTSPDWQALLLDRCVRPRRIERIARVVERTTTEPLPELDKLVAAPHALILRDAGRAGRLVRHVATPLSKTGRGMLALRLTRWFFVLLPLLVLAGIAVVAFEPPPAIRATASAHYQNRSRFEPGRVVDGNTETEWLLPNKTKGWIDLEFDPPRRVNRIGILNAVNGGHRDRSTKAYRIEVYARGRRIRTIGGSFTGLQSRRAQRERFVYLGVSRVEKIRVHVLSYSGKGAGIAEITID